MVPGELIPEAARSEQREGTVITASGRVSAAAEVVTEPPPVAPFSPSQMARLDDALTLVSRYTRLPFSIYLGALDAPTRSAAEGLHDRLGPDSVLIAIDPGQREMSIVTGSQAKVRLPDRACHLAVMSMLASFCEGDLLGGLLSGLRMLADQAGAPG